MCQGSGRELDKNVWVKIAYKTILEKRKREEQRRTARAPFSRAIALNSYLRPSSRPRPASASSFASPPTPSVRH